MKEKHHFSLGQKTEALLHNNMGFKTEDADNRPAAASYPPLEGRKLDALRILLIEAVHLVSSQMVERRLREGVKKLQSTLARLGDLCSKILEAPVDASVIQICHRGFTSSASRTGEFDYDLVFGDVVVDLGIAKSMARRMGVQMSHLDKRLLKSFEVFSNQFINSLDIRVPNQDSVTQMEEFQMCLFILARFHQASKMGGLIKIDYFNETKFIPTIQNLMGQDDPNLTMLAGLNNLSHDDMDQLIKTALEESKKDDDLLKNGLHNAILSSKTAKGKLKRPPIEVNGSRYEIARPGWEQKESTRSDGQANQEVDNNSTNAEETENILHEEPNDRITQLIRENFSKDPKIANGMIKGVYGNDYKRINARQLASRVNLVSRLLDALEKNPQAEKILKELLNHIEGRMEQVSENVLGDIAIQDGVLKVRMGGKEGTVGKINPRLLKTISSTKSRVGIRKKMRNIVRGQSTFTPRDYKALADDFNIPVQDAKDIVELLKGCFDDKGRFLRKNFEASIPAFAKYERKIFEFVWQYLKDTLRRQDRVAFLNSLQHLIAAMKQPQQAIGVLMTDFLKTPTVVSYSDRNAIMLSNLLIRKYNKELNLDIEMTPEEVLLVREGIDMKIAEAVSKVIDASQERFMRKMRTIRNKIRIALGLGDQTDSTPMPLRYLVTLEREVFIFLALVRGKTARTLLRHAANTYGDPSSDIYRLKHSRKNLIVVMQHLKVILRALARIGTESDLSLLDRIGNSDQGFMRLAQKGQEQDKVRQVLRWAEISRDTILKKTVKDSRDADGFTVAR